MAGFDIVPMVETIGIRGNKYRVRGLDVEHIGPLFSDFPEVRKMFAEKSIDVSALIKASSRLVNTIIVGGLREATVNNMEGSVKNMMLGEKAKVLTAIVRMTMPDGLDPFVELMNALGVTSADGGQVAAAPKVIRLKTTSSERAPISSERVTTRAAMS